MFTGGLCLGIILGWMIRGIYVWRNYVLVERGVVEDEEEQP